MPKDKILHVIVGFIIGFLGAYFLRSAPFGFGLAVITGVGKEVYDKISGKGTPEAFDSLATVVGGFIGAGITILMRA